jgi:hypothetical protein
MRKTATKAEEQLAEEAGVPNPGLGCVRPVIAASRSGKRCGDREGGVQQGARLRSARQPSSIASGMMVCAMAPSQASGRVSLNHQFRTKCHEL